MAFLSQINTLLWGSVLLVPMFGIGLYYSVRLRFFQVTGIRIWFRETFGTLGKQKTDGLSPFQTLSTALGGTMGTGNIVGVATAIAAGGPGALFWMWIAAFFGMMLKYAETVLAVRYRVRGEKGWVGGTMFVLRNRLKMPRVAMCFSVFCVFASLGMGNMVQCNAIAEALNDAFGIPRLISGVGITVLFALIICGGISRIASFATALIPTLSVAYFICGVAVIVLNGEHLLPCLREMIRSALLPAAISGGVAGYGLRSAVRFGFARGIFSNEAGLGSSGMVYATAENGTPTVQGMWAILEVFADTAVCSVTGLAILVSGAFDPSAPLTGGALTVAAFATVFGKIGGLLIALAIVLFAFPSAVSWAYYGECGFCDVAGENGGFCYRVLFLACVVPGCVFQLEPVWHLSELFNALMALPNLLTLVLLRRAVLSESGRIRRIS